MPYIFSPKPAQKELIEGLVQSGSYKNQEEVLNAAVNLLGGKDTTKLQRLRGLLKEGINSGEAKPVDRNQFLNELRAEP